MRANVSALPKRTRTSTRLDGPSARLPRGAVAYAVVGLAASAAQLAGGWWDVAWHAALGRESFWSAPHLLIYAGVLALLSAGGLGLLARLPATTTGMAVAASGTLAQVASAPLDELWHRLYGIDVTIWSPPHLLLIAGMAVAPLGLALAVAAERGTAVGDSAGRALVVGLLTASLTAASGALGELLSHGWARDPLLYPLLVGLLLAPPLVAAPALTGLKLGATAVALAHAAVVVCLDLVIGAALPHGHPPAAPPLLPLSALAVDLVHRRLAREWDAGAVALTGVLFGALFVALDAPVTHALTAAQWPAIADYLSRPLPAGAPRPQLGVALPWGVAGTVAALGVACVTGVGGTLVGRWLASAALAPPAAAPQSAART